ncbi:hypothetical protein [Planomicrobium sp. MB-3u-38]|uniref:hypothetical protein n=1 Tax=Planomicrobium sp. MB-3u-38 TaxID=2058318 RepID=UPI000C7B6E86|nr:hypothetical protein [Planomicrobium sp. MB-3u-38]PKH09826.1 hypothetical protein CXF70_11455 [Planomicrobium sp. MB-3u-38]
MNEELDYSEVFKFMQEFQVDYLNRYQEMIIDEPTNTYVSIKTCKDMDDVKTFVVFALCRPIGKGLEKRKANMLLKRVNQYFEMDLTREDMHLMYGELCYLDKFEKFKDFIKRGFPMHELPYEHH